MRRYLFTEEEAQEAQYGRVEGRMYDPGDVPPVDLLAGKESGYGQSGSHEGKEESRASRYAYVFGVHGHVSGRDARREWKAAAGLCRAVCP